VNDRLSTRPSPKRFVRRQLDNGRQIIIAGAQMEGINNNVMWRGIFTRGVKISKGEGLRGATWLTLLTIRPYLRINQPLTLTWLVPSEEGQDRTTGRQGEATVAHRVPLLAGSLYPSVPMPLALSMVDSWIQMLAGWLAGAVLQRLFVRMVLRVNYFSLITIV
jgi:hypothetical protein